MRPFKANSSRLALIAAYAFAAITCACHAPTAAAAPVAHRCCHRDATPAPTPHGSLPHKGNGCPHCDGNFLATPQPRLAFVDAHHAPPVVALIHSGHAAFSRSFAAAPVVAVH